MPRTHLLPLLLLPVMLAHPQLHSDSLRVSCSSPSASKLQLSNAWAAPTSEHQQENLLYPAFLPSWVPPTPGGISMRRHSESDANTNPQSFRRSRFGLNIVLSPNRRLRTAVQPDVLLNFAKSRRGDTPSMVFGAGGDAAFPAGPQCASGVGLCVLPNERGEHIVTAVAPYTAAKQNGAMPGEPSQQPAQLLSNVWC